MKYIVSVNGKQYNVEVEKVAGGYQPVSRQNNTSMDKLTEPAPKTHSVQSVSEKKPIDSMDAYGSGNQTKMEAPMPGNILDVKVNVGDKVNNGQVILVLEAMKMENEIVSPVDGVIASVMVKKGDIVDSGDMLVIIK